MNKTMAAAGVAVGLAFGGTAVQAGSLESMTVALELGSVLAAEESCNLHYDTVAVQRYIAAHVSSSDMGFGSSLQMMVEGQRYQMQSMTPATLTALCTQTRRVAKVNGFVE